MKFSSADYQTLCTRKNLLLSEQLIELYGKFCATLKVIPTTVKENLKILAASIVNDMEFSSKLLVTSYQTRLEEFYELGFDYIKVFSQ